MDSARECFLLFTSLGLISLQTSAIETVNVADFCGQTVRGDGMIVNSHQETKKYYFVTTGTDCHLTMQAISPKDKVQFYFRFFLVYSLLRVAPLSPAPLSPKLEPLPADGQGDPCHAGSYIQFYDGQDKNSPPIGPPLCGKSPPRPVLSTGNHLTLRLVTRGTQPRVDFIGDFTSFRLGFNQSECSAEPYFTCRNGKCIPQSLVCDDKGIDNCGDGSDLEENLSTGCKAGHILPPPLTTASTPAYVNPSTLVSSTHEHCGTPESTPNHESVTDSTSWVSMQALYILLGLVAAAVLLCWCCWSPGWCLWRFGICRLFPCCNIACSSCQLCARSFGQNKEHRPAKVTPHVPGNGTPVVAISDADGVDASITAAFV